MNPSNERDPYVVNADLIQDPPTRFLGQLKYLGPGFVLSAAIVGSGELIATTTLGAKAGFVTFWVILVSCLVKVAIQVEYGKHAIHSGETVMTAFNKLPGLRLGKAHWTIWSWVGIMILKILQVGGIIGGVAITLNIAFPLIPIWSWTLSIAVLVSLLVFRGQYRFIEGLSIILIGLFTLFTFACLAAIQYTPYAISWAQIAEGMSFQLPASALAIAVGAFGLTGVGGDEITYYNYWCIEKGYAAYTGPNDNSPEWQRRAKGWIRVMYLDATLSMVVYTLVTAAFYLLGAAVLHSRGEIPEGYDMVRTLSNMYTETLGPWANSLFLIGAVLVLFSTLFTALSAWTRLFTDAFGHMGLINFWNLAERKRSLIILSWIFPLLWGAIFLFLKLPVLMVIIGGVLTSILLVIIVYVAIYFRYKRLPMSLKPSTGYDVIFWVSAVAIFAMGVYGVWKLI
ncbi:MAG: Nramp family divalent metal transporter [Bacteroidota bacterium]